MVKSGRINLNTPLTLTAPTYLWLAFTVFLPLSAMFFFSFLTDAPFGNKEVFFSLENYQAIWDKTFYQLLLFKSFRLGLEVTVLCFLIGFPCALILAKHVKGYWREAIFVLIILPFWSNALVRIFSWTMVLRGNGVIEMTLNWIFPGFGDFSLMFTYQAILIGLVHSYLPYMILTCYVSIQSIDDSIIEAARVLGASRIMILMRLIIPLSLPGIAAGSVLIFIPVVGSFMEPRILGGREGTFIGTIIEDQFTRVFNWPLGAALSFLMLFIILIIILLSNRFSKSLR
ncbi:MAG: ABC transporter permease [SAR324 cluster bacterium]|nr:ABC transporter permease [SAR324 cluster bacterium]